MSTLKLRISPQNVKKIFVLEDNEDRITWFRGKLASIQEVVYSKKAGEAIGLLTATKFDLIFLDHDLDNEVFVDSRMELDSGDWNTGYQVAKKLIDTVNKDTVIIVHSMNPDGANNIARVRPENTIKMPFFALKDSLEVVTDETN